MTFHGLRVRIENPAGTTRSGIDGKGKPWSVVMSHDYGEILGTEGVDGDPIDCFIGPNKSAKWVYIIHQTRKEGNAWDEDKVMLGFDDVMKAKEAYFKNFDEPEHFYASITTLSMEDFKNRISNSKKQPQMIFGSKMNTAIALYTGKTSGPSIGMPVTVDGFHGRGVVVKKEGTRFTIRFRSGQYISRDAKFVHSMDENTVSQMWRK